MKHILTLFFVMTFTFQGVAAEGASVYGKIIESKNTVHGLTSPYYVTFEHEGKPLAFPVEADNRNMADLIVSFVNKDAVIEGEMKKRTFKTDGRTYTVETFIPRAIRPLKLSSLGEVEWTTPETPAPKMAADEKEKKIQLTPGTRLPHEDKLGKTNGPRPGPGFTTRINDSVANGLIFTGAAAILATQLFKKK